MTALISRPARPLTGAAAVPGDKSISHRALILGALAVGETRIAGLLASADVFATVAAVKALGAQAEQGENGDWRVYGRGVGGLAEPQGVLDMGNSGTAARLLIGVVATHPFTATFAGDKSLSVRPMERVMTPLRQMGAVIDTAEGGRPPLRIKGGQALKGIHGDRYHLWANAVSGNHAQGLHALRPCQVANNRPAKVRLPPSRW